MMARWLLGLKNDEVSAQKTFRMFAAFVAKKGNLSGSEIIRFENFVTYFKYYVCYLHASNVKMQLFLEDVQLFILKRILNH